MRNFFLTGLLAVGAIASPVAVDQLESRAAPCLTNADAQKVAQNFRALIHEPFNVTLAKTAFAVDFVDYSDSVNEVSLLG